ncbi:cysteinyl leukotriene receptor 1 [Erythrolamprus reginae]|uniref:cysteinyl leukotriene receptor 1 n=1 Tax=Erythrolamprus reginae TaxID=121349 RepID=UPI00396C300A
MVFPANMTHNMSCNSSIAEFRSQVYPVTYSIISILGFVGNAFVLFVLIRTYHEKTAFQIYMFNLAIADLLFVCTLPLRVVYYLYNGNWFFGDFLCRISSYAMYVNLYCSILFMTAMSFFRCIAIVFPIWNIKFISRKRAIMVCVGIWFFVTLTTTPFLQRSTHLSSENTTKCFEPPRSQDVRKVMVLHYISLFIGFIFPFVTITICYTMILNKLLKNPMHKKETTRKKAIWMILIVTAVFLISFTPYHVQRTVHLHLMRDETSCESLYMQKSVVITYSLAAFNCCFNPLLYYFSGGNFRRRLSTFQRGSISSTQHRKLSSKEEAVNGNLVGCDM